MSEPRGPTTEELRARALAQGDAHTAGDWRESDAVKQARMMLVEVGSPLWPGLTESDWAEVLRGVLAERDMIGEWLQRCLDAEYARQGDEGYRDVAHTLRRALAALVAAVDSENFSRTGRREMSHALRATLRDARSAASLPLDERRAEHLGSAPMSNAPESYT